MSASRDAALADLAAEQHGLVSLRQTNDVGLTPQARQRRVRSRRLLQHGPLVFAMPGAPATPEQALLAAVFDAGEGAVATRGAAAWLWGLPGFRWQGAEVLVKRSGDHQCRLGALSETSWLPPNHVTVLRGIPVVTLARLCFELAATEHPKRVERAVDNALVAGMAIDDFAEVVGTLGKRGRPGTRVSRAILAARGEGYVPPASELEALGFAVLRAGGLPEPVRQLDVGTQEHWVGRVDCAYPAARLLIEFDGRRHWQVLLEAEADRRRDAELVAAGWRVLRFTWDQLRNDPDWVVRSVWSALRAAA